MKSEAGPVKNINEIYKTLARLIKKHGKKAKLPYQE